MTEPNQNQPATVSDQPEAVSPLKKSTPIIVILVSIVALIGIVNLSSLVGGGKKAAAVSSMPQRPASANPQQVSSFESQQRLQAGKDADDRQHQQELAVLQQQLQTEQAVPGPEAPALLQCQRRSVRRSTGIALMRPSRHRTSLRRRQRPSRGHWCGRSCTRTPSIATPLPSTSPTHPPPPRTPMQTTAVLGERDEVTPKIVQRNDCRLLGMSLVRRSRRRTARPTQ